MKRPTHEQIRNKLWEWVIYGTIGILAATFLPGWLVVTLGAGAIVLFLLLFVVLWLTRPREVKR